MFGVSKLLGLDSGKFIQKFIHDVNANALGLGE